MLTAGQVLGVFGHKSPIKLEKDHGTRPINNVVAPDESVTLRVSPWQCRGVNMVWRQCACIHPRLYSPCLNARAMKLVTQRGCVNYYLVNLLACALCTGFECGVCLL
jgi:hypothetical protein